VALSAALRWRLGAAAPKFELPPKSDPRDRWLTPAEADRLLAACERRHLRLFILLGLHTAARSHAILSLTWDRVDLEQGRIDYREPGVRGTRKRRVPVPINGTLLAELKAAKARRETDYVIEWAGGPIRRIVKAMAATAKRAGMPDVTPHVLRHTAATWMLQSGVPIWQVAGMLGYSDTQMVNATYGHHASDFLQSASQALENSARLTKVNTGSEKPCKILSFLGAADAVNTYRRLKNQ
jgi:integrase